MIASVQLLLLTAALALPGGPIEAVLVEGGPPPQATAADVAPVAIMPLTSLGSTDETVAAVERVLHGELRRLLGARLVTQAELGRADRHLQAHVGNPHVHDVRHVHRLHRTCGVANLADPKFGTHYRFNINRHGLIRAPDGRGQAAA